MDRSSRRLSEMDQQGLLGYSSPQYHLLFYIGYLSRAFTLLILYTPYSLLHSLPICSLSYPTPSFCRSVLSYSHCATSYMHTWLSFFCNVSRHAQAKNWHHFLKTAALLINCLASQELFFFITLPIFFYFSHHPSHSFTIHTDTHIESFLYPSIFDFTSLPANCTSYIYGLFSILCFQNNSIREKLKVQIVWTTTV